MIQLATLAATTEGRWRPGIGDPTPLGWLTVAAYAVAAAACYWAARRDIARTGRRSWFWLGLFALMCVLGVNKQLDVQTWVTQVGRDLFRAWGAYDRRRPFQVGFIAAVAAACAGLMVVAVRMTRGDLARRVAAGGLVFLLGFVVVRAASFHRVDVLLAATVGGLRWNWVFELSGIGLIAAGAIRSGRN